jgi:hypothetical protein
MKSLAVKQSGDVLCKHFAVNNPFSRRITICVGWNIKDVPGITLCVGNIRKS